jgi:hypothetical protein
MKKYFFLFLALAGFIIKPVNIVAQHTTTPFEELNEIPAGKAVIYIYRVSTYAVAVHYRVNANDKPVMNTHLYIGGYMVYLANPGKVELWAEMGKHHESTTLDVEAGKSYFVEGSVISDAWTSRPCFTLVSRENALRKINKCRLLVDR